MPRDGAADAEAFAERILRQLRAGLQRLLDDGAAKRAADHADLVGRFCGFAGGARRHRRILRKEVLRMTTRYHNWATIERLNCMQFEGGIAQKESGAFRRFW